MGFGPYGLDPYGSGVGAFPHALQDFQVRPGLEGPQAVCTWVPPLQAISRLMIRRKVGEYPRDPEDGVLVVDTVEAPNTMTACIDVGADLLATDAIAGASRWWYYRAFVQPSPLPLALQFGGRAVQVISQENAFPNTLETLDVQEFRNIRIEILNTDTVDAFAVFYVRTAPEPDGPWSYVEFEENVASLATEVREYADASFKYLQVIGDGRQLEVRVIVNRSLYWATGVSMSKPCLVYKTGRHVELMYGDHLPTEFTAPDETMAQVYLTESEDDIGEIFKLGKQHEPRGYLYRFLSILGLELDRNHAYISAVREFDTDLDEVPEAQLQHVAFELGWQVDMSRPLNDIREELFRLAGVWKARGTTALFESVVSQHLGLIPRIQEGAGLLLRVANPSLWDRPLNTAVDEDDGIDVIGGP